MIDSVIRALGIAQATVEESRSALLRANRERNATPGPYRAYTAEVLALGAAARLISRVIDSLQRARQ